MEEAKFGTDTAPKPLNQFGYCFKIITLSTSRMREIQGLGLLRIDSAVMALRMRERNRILTWISKHMRCYKALMLKQEHIRRRTISSITFHAERRLTGAQLLVAVDNLLVLPRGESTAAARRVGLGTNK